jgi:choline kinase
MDLIVLASGVGRRLKSINESRPKCLLEVQKKPILEHTSKIFKYFKNIYIVGGYKFSLLKKYKNKNVKLIYNKDFQKTNMVESLFKAKKKIKNDLIIVYADIIFDPKIIQKLKSKKNNVLPLKKNWLDIWKLRMKRKEIKKDAENVIFNKQKIVSIGGEIKKFPQAQYMGIIKLKKKDFYKSMKFYKKLNNKKIDMTNFINLSIKNKILTFNYLLTKKFWYEFDTPEDVKNFKKFKIII